jgi:hypothetical protein
VLICRVAHNRRLDTRVCMYTDSNDSDFVVDRDVKFKNVVVARLDSAVESCADASRVLLVEVVDMRSNSCRAWAF